MTDVPTAGHMPAATASASRGRILTRARARAIRHGLALVGIVALPYVIVVNRGTSFWGFDAWAYWATDLGDLYGRSLGNTTHLGAFRYTPAVAQVLEPLGAIPWEAFFVGWLALTIAAFAWLTGRHALLWLAFPPIALELYHLNIHVFLALAIVLSFRWPALWAFVALTKVTPAVGALWFAFRREWRSFGVAVGTTVAIVAVSYLVAPDLWRQYVATMVDNYSAPAGDDRHFYPLPVPLFARLPIAVAIVFVAARTDRRWLVPVACTLALPIIWWHGLSMLVGAAWLWFEDRRVRSAPAMVEEPT
jgi:hypothetical protein